MQLQIERVHIEAMTGRAAQVAKYCRHRNVAPTLDVFERCSIFRGMDASASTSAHEVTS